MILLYRILHYFVVWFELLLTTLAMNCVGLLIALFYWMPVAEAKHRLRRMTAVGKTEVFLDDIPGAKGTRR